MTDLVLEVQSNRLSDPSGQNLTVQSVSNDPDVHLGWRGAGSPNVVEGTVEPEEVFHM